MRPHAGRPAAGVRSVPRGPALSFMV